MDIRTLDPAELDPLLDLLDGWKLPDGWQGRSFFHRAIEYDPTFAYENIWVATDSGELHACVQIFPRRLRVLGHAVPTGGIGSVFTRAESRGSGLATAVLERATAAMHERGMELSLLFSDLTTFYEKRGWSPWRGERIVLRRSGNKADSDPATSAQSAAAKASESSADVELSPFDPDRDLEAVKAIHSAYSAQRSGTVVRDAEMWAASLELAGNPDEEFWVARCRGSVIAYARATLLYEVFTVTELARLDEGAGALAALMRMLLTPRSEDALAPGGKSSEELRAFALVPSFDDIPFTVALENDGVSAHPLEDSSAMLACLAVEALAHRLDVSLLPDEDGARFLARILPPDHFVFWPSDRF